MSDENIDVNKEIEENVKEDTTTKENIEKENLVASIENIINEKESKIIENVERDIEFVNKINLDKQNEIIETTETTEKPIEKTIEKPIEKAFEKQITDREEHVVEKNNPVYERDEYVFLAKLYEKAEKPEETIDFIKKFIALNPVLNKEERNVLNSGYKYHIGKNRSSWRLLQMLEKKEEKRAEMNPEHNLAHLSSIREIKERVEDELRRIIDDIQELLDEVLLPNATKNEQKVYYLKLKGDYYRYMAEFTVKEEQEEAMTQAEIAYNEAYEIAEKNLSISNVTRLGLALNFSIFCYETRNLKEDACMIAKNAFEESMKVLDDLEKNKAKDTILIIQLLKENLLLWTNELNEEEGD